MGTKTKTSYQSLTEKYHHAVVECEQKDKRIKELEKEHKNIQELEKVHKRIMDQNLNQANTIRDLMKDNINIKRMLREAADEIGQLKNIITEKDEDIKQLADKIKELNMRRVNSELSILSHFAAQRNADMLKAANKHIDELQKYKAEHDPYKHLYDALKAGKWVKTTDQHGNEVTVKGHAESIEFKLPACEYVIVEPESVDPKQIYRNQTIDFLKEQLGSLQPKPKPVYTSFNKEELKSLVGKVITNASNPDNVCIITRYQGLDFVESGKLQIPASNLVKYWLLDGKPCGKEQK